MDIDLGKPKRPSRRKSELNAEISRKEASPLKQKGKI